MIHVQNQNEIIKLMEEGAPLVIKWTATWCGPCKQISPLFEKLANQYTDLIFIHADIDKLHKRKKLSKLIQGNTDVTGVPAFWLVEFENDSYKLVQKVVGANSVELTKMLSKFD